MKTGSLYRHQWTLAGQILNEQLACLSCQQNLDVELDFDPELQREPDVVELIGVDEIQDKDVLRCDYCGEKTLTWDVMTDEEVPF